MQTFNILIYPMAVLASIACTLFLFRAYIKTGIRLLLWSALCFVGLSISNVLLYVDLVVFPTQVDLRLYRSGASLIGLLFLLYGFIWESE